MSEQISFMISEQGFLILRDYSNLPGTEEKEEITRKFLDSEIGNYEFFCLANTYLQKITTETH